MTIASSRSRTDQRCPAQRGQAVLEFALGLLLIVAAIAGLYQALHFELDVFNKLSLLRYRAMENIHRAQHETEKAFEGETMYFRPLPEVTPHRVPFQIEDWTLSYPPKTLYYRVGTKYNDPFVINFMGANAELHGFWPIFGMLSATEGYEDGPKLREIVAGSSIYWIPAFPDLNDQ